MKHVRIQRVSYRHRQEAKHNYDADRCGCRASKLGLAVPPDSECNGNDPAVPPLVAPLTACGAPTVPPVSFSVFSGGGGHLESSGEVWPVCSHDQPRSTDVLLRRDCTQCPIGFPQPGPLLGRKLTASVSHKLCLGGTRDRERHQFRADTAVLECRAPQVLAQQTASSQDWWRRQRWHSDKYFRSSASNTLREERKNSRRPEGFIAAPSWGKHRAPGWDRRRLVGQDNN